MEWNVPSHERALAMHGAPQRAGVDRAQAVGRERAFERGEGQIVE